MRWAYFYRNLNANYMYEATYLDLVHVYRPYLQKNNRNNPIFGHQTH